VTLLDAYALIAYLVGGPAKAQVGAILRQPGAAVATANLIETLDVAQRVHGLPISRAMDIIEPLFESALTSIGLDITVARRAAEIRANHYHRSKRPISLADAILIGSAGSGDRIATADPDVLAVARAEHIQVIQLPED
jgi:predicted nucleic acid-binding protein